MSEIHVHVHGVVPASDEAPAPEGVRRIPHRDIAALVSDVDAGQPVAAALLRAHWRALEEVATSTTVLPVRVGTVLADDRSVIDDFLAPGHEELAAGLAELAGKVQLTVKGFYDEAALMRTVVEGSPAVARLRERVRGVPEAAAYYDRIELGRLVATEVERARERDTELAVERLAPLAVAVSREPPATADGAINVAFLVERTRIDEFSRAVAALGSELGDRISLRYVGPLPPFSFVAEQGVTAWA